MYRSGFGRLAGLLLGCAVGVAAAGDLNLFDGPAMPSLAGDTLVHDPSVMLIDGRFVSFSTGIEQAADGGMPIVKSSEDGVIWVDHGSLPGGQPDWIQASLLRVPPNLWAPQITMHDGVAYLYVSASLFGQNRSAIGLFTNAQFDSANPTAGWEDQGEILRSRTLDAFNAIDPFRIDLSDGRAFLAFGSWWDGIRMGEIDPVSGRLMAPVSEALKIASRRGGAIEAPALLEHDGRFYLFVSYDHCCRGTASDYKIVVGRAEAIEGPYLDPDGRDLYRGEGGLVVLESTRRFRGPGGQEVFDTPDGPMLAFHYYDALSGGKARLQLTRLLFDEAGWPYVPNLPD